MEKSQMNINSMLTMFQCEMNVILNDTNKKTVRLTPLSMMYHVTNCIDLMQYARQYKQP